MFALYLFKVFVKLVLNTRRGLLASIDAVTEYDENLQHISIYFNGLVK